MMLAFIYFLLFSLVEAQSILQFKINFKKTEKERRGFPIIEPVCLSLSFSSRYLTTPHPQAVSYDPLALACQLLPKARIYGHALHLNTCSAGELNSTILAAPGHSLLPPPVAKAKKGNGSKSVQSHLSFA